jgi:NADH-quinone oxidoreductase subunit L
MVTALPWIILLAPASACLGTVLFVRRSKALSAILAIGAMAVGWVASLTAWLLFTPETHAIQSSLDWIVISELKLEFGLLLDPLAILMSLVVTGVGLAIFIYSVGYMAHEPGFRRYFIYLSLFAFSMLGIVLANNFVTLFIFWELVGASSYLLIGYWYERPSAAAAGKKAFLVNRLADFGFLLGILWVWNLSGIGGETHTLNFLELAQRMERGGGMATHPILPLAAALIFCGVVGKSAQFPLHVWLPDAMEGPTPVSALIHAATMVAAGVYLLGRVFFLFSSTPILMPFIAWVGAITAFFAATLAWVENDIKRILAYSTLSQLGYMVMAMGLGGPTASLYHLTTHAFFKALLFLGAGAVIHALHTNDIRQMGGLWRKMPITGTTFLIGALALCGLFPLSGFWSKDEILAVAFHANPILGAIGTLTAGLTGFYMGRLWCVAFLPKGGFQEREPIHEAPWVMTGPLLALCVPTVLAGGFQIPAYLHHAGIGVGHDHHTGTPQLWIALASNGAALLGLAVAWAIYVGGVRMKEGFQEVRSGIVTLLERKYYVDEIYGWINHKVQQRWAEGLGMFERYVIIGLCVNGTAKLTGWMGALVRLAQTGKVQTYAFLFLASVTWLIHLSWRWGP